ncbi:response regulator [uncultured Tateyamaria sp.]|uniref:response regulator n=1 Tax=uncultured Tateyamaria sp. TaxID=455651 RepID=UPI0026026243|nr:response regulator [uncultured Tateyamaria sp.]
MTVVLLLEDDPGLQFAFKEALEDAGYDVHTASNNEDAMSQLRRCTPDILLLDLMIDGAMSTDVANYAGYAAPDAEVIFMTGSGLFPKGELFGISQNARLVLRKPVDLHELTTMVAHVVTGDDEDAAYVARA